MHLIVFSPILTSRIKYIFTFIFKEILKTEVEFTGNRQYYLQSKHFKITYADQPLGDELFFKSASFLLSNKLEEIVPKLVSFGDYQVPFPVQNSALPFDVFAASFYFVSRYEEYIYAQKEKGDFKASKSLQYKLKILDRPIVDEWALILKSIISKRYPEFRFLFKKFTVKPIVTVQISPTIPAGFSNKLKFFSNALLSKDNSYLNGKFDEITGLEVNPVKVLNQLNPSLRKKPDRLLFFLNLPSVESSFIPIKALSKVLETHQIGLLRPCIDHQEKIRVFKTAAGILKSIQPAQTNTISLQLEPLKLPTCYLNVLNLGVSTDYSMGYVDVAGFRAGTCTPFNWYDLQLEKVTSLQINSYCLTSKYLSGISPREAQNEILNYENTIRGVSGVFTICWALKNISGSEKYKKLAEIFHSIAP
ncbi:DUF7033 domain-containing protein [Pedobacter sp. AW1-32]|uniref:DUF7033 domain-containing protein n=1 Tax=Pedobacter sp. AW1-32 TaxID=3383026 RepID=UPI003FEF317F